MTERIQATEKAKEAKKDSILVVDDQMVNLRILLNLLKHHNFQVKTAQSGEEALEILEHFKADLILMDVMMPGLNGFDTCQIIKETPATADIPVIFITALDSTKDKITAFEAGGVDYITKPFQKQEVLARINTHLTLRRQKLALEKALREIKQLSGIIPICASCKKIRNDKGYWQQVEQYITEHSDAMFSHGLCPECVKKHYHIDGLV